MRDPGHDISIERPTQSSQSQPLSGWLRCEDATQRRFHGAGDDWRAKAGASLPMGKLGQVGEIADFVVFLLSDRSGVVTGSVIDWDQNVLGGMD